MLRAARRRASSSNWASAQATNPRPGIVAWRACQGRSGPVVAQVGGWTARPLAGARAVRTPRPSASMRAGAPAIARQSAPRRDVQRDSCRVHGPSWACAWPWMSTARRRFSHSILNRTFAPAPSAACKLPIFALRTRHAPPHAARRAQSKGPASKEGRNSRSPFAPPPRHRTRGISQGSSWCRHAPPRPRLDAGPRFPSRPRPLNSSRARALRVASSGSVGPSCGRPRWPWPRRGRSGCRVRA